MYSDMCTCDAGWRSVPCALGCWGAALNKGSGKGFGEERAGSPASVASWFAAYELVPQYVTLHPCLSVVIACTSCVMWAAAPWPGTLQAGAAWWWWWWMWILGRRRSVACLLSDTCLLSATDPRMASRARHATRSREALSVLCDGGTVGVGHMAPMVVCIAHVVTSTSVLRVRPQCFLPWKMLYDSVMRAIVCTAFIEPRLAPWKVSCVLTVCWG